MPIESTDASGDSVRASASRSRSKRNERADGMPIRRQRAEGHEAAKPQIGEEPERGRMGADIARRDSELGPFARGVHLQAHIDRSGGMPLDFLGKAHRVDGVDHDHVGEDGPSLVCLEVADQMPADGDVIQERALLDQFLDTILPGRADPAEGGTRHLGGQGLRHTDQGDLGRAASGTGGRAGDPLPDVGVAAARSTLEVHPEES